MIHPQGWSPLFAGCGHLEGKTAPADVPECMARRQETARQGTQVNKDKHRLLSSRMKVCLKHSGQWEVIREDGEPEGGSLGYLLGLVHAQHVSPLSLDVSWQP